MKEYLRAVGAVIIAIVAVLFSTGVLWIGYQVTAVFLGLTRGETATAILVIALVAAQFMQVAISAYMNAACASFFLTVSSENGMSSARRQMRDRLRQMGMDDSAIDRAGFGENPPHGDDTPGDGEGDGS